MNRYKSILYFISAVILATLVIQVYYNMRAYDAGKRRLWHEVQISTDQALDNYYLDLSEKNTIGFSVKGDSTFPKYKLDSILKRIDVSSKGMKGLDSLNPDKISELRVFKGSQVKNMDTLYKRIKVQSSKKREAINHFFNAKPGDSLNDLAKLTSRIIIAITTDTLNLKTLTPYIAAQLKSRDIPVRFGYVFKNNSDDRQVYNPKIDTTTSYSIISRSPYLPKRSMFTLYYDQVAPILLRRGLLSISLSAILIGSVIACLLFLLKIINRQKQLAELKNDLISNITHEFKTPIATIGVALEGIENFNAQNDPAKTKNYVRTSTAQLEKLNLMVEKLLETATLDSSDVQLKKEPIDMLVLLQNLINKHRSLAPQKGFLLNGFGQNLILSADPFYLENALNNILDNAVKYGGDQINVSLTAENRTVLIKISDNGKTLTPAQARQVFEKFYRVPKGNTHDVKGFGIGLYYTKKIIEKHGGSVEVSTNEGTTFKIILPNGQ